MRFKQTLCKCGVTFCTFKQISDGVLHAMPESVREIGTAHARGLTPINMFFLLISDVCFAGLETPLSLLLWAGNTFICAHLIRMYAEFKMRFAVENGPAGLCRFVWMWNFTLLLNRCFAFIHFFKDGSWHYSDLLPGIHNCGLKWGHFNLIAMQASYYSQLSLTTCTLLISKCELLYWKCLRDNDGIVPKGNLSCLHSPWIGVNTGVLTLNKK